MEGGYAAHTGEVDSPLEALRAFKRGRKPRGLSWSCWSHAYLHHAACVKPAYDPALRNAGADKHTLVGRTCRGDRPHRPAAGSNDGHSFQGKQASQGRFAYVAGIEVKGIPAV